MKKLMLLLTVLASTQVFAAQHAKKKMTLIVTGSVAVSETQSKDTCKAASLSATKQAFRICDRLVGKRPYGALKSCQQTADGRVTQDLVFKCI